MPFAGAEFQEAGVLVALNELASATALALIPLPKLLGFQDQKRNEIKPADIALLESVGALDLLTAKDKFAEMWQQMQKDFKY
jgi:hypothetical protein